MALTTIEQGLSFVQYEADGTTPNFPVTFQYLQQSDVKVFIGNTEVFYTWLNAAEVTPNTLPSAGDIVTVRRFTTNTERLVDFQDGGQVSERDLDKDSNQLFFLTQESNDTAAFNLTTDPLLQVVDFRGNRGINLAAPVDPTDAINKQYIDDLESAIDAAIVTANNASDQATDAAAAALAIEGIAQAAEDKVDLHLTDETAHDAAFIVNTPAGDIVATDVQAAINELDTEKQAKSEKGMPDGYASLDATGKVPAVQLPSFVDDVEEYADLAAFPVTGESGKIYVALDTSKAYRWSGTVYTEISPSEVNSVNGQTGVVVLDKADVGLDQVDNTSDATKNAAVADLTNKALISPSRLDPKKDTLDNLLDYASLTGMNGELVYATDTKEFFVITDNDLVAAGGGAGSSNSLLINPSFDGREEEWSCTNATGALVTSTMPTPQSDKMFEMTVTAAGGYCDFIAPTGTKFEGLPFTIGGFFQTELLDAEYCTLVDGVESNCIPLDAVASLATDPFKKALSTQDLSGATSNGLRIKTTSSTSGVINSSKIALDLGTLPTGQAISCDGDLDCENVFSAYVAGSASPSVVSSLSVTGWIDDCSRIAAGRWDCPINGFTEIPNCTGMVRTGGNFNRTLTVDYPSSTPTSLRLNVADTANVGDNLDFTLVCQKAAPDFKPITERGVVNVGVVDTFKPQEKILSASVTTTQDVADLTFTGLTVGATYLISGFIEINSASFSINELRFYSAAAAGGTLYGNNLARYEGSTEWVGSSPSIIFTAVSDTLVPRFIRPSSGQLTGNGTKEKTFLQLTRLPDYMSVQASLIDRKIYDGNEYPAKEIAVVGGVEKQVYRRCYEIASDITTTTTIATIDTGLEMLRSQKITSGVYYFGEYSYLGSGTDLASFRYTSSTGVLDYLINGRTVFAGTKPCIYYTKP